MNRTNIVSGSLGLVFGFLFCGAGFNQYDVIHNMLLLRNLSPFLVMGSAVVVAMPSLWLLERHNWHTPLGGRLQLRRCPVERKHIFGGIVFGTGWAITGCCPGSVAGMIGAGGLLGFVVLGGIVTGIALRDAVVDTPPAARRDAWPEPDGATP